MSPAARKFEKSLNLPTITTGSLAVSFISPDFSSQTSLRIAHSNKVAKGLMKDWMQFTNVLGNGIFDNI